MKNHPTKKLWKYKLDDTKRRWVCQKLAEFHTTAEIVDMVKKKYDIDINRHSIGVYMQSPRWKPFIQKYREAYLSRLEDVAIANKRVRLEVIDGVVDRNEGIKDQIVLSAVAEARKEMEGDGQADHSTNIAIQYNSMSDDEIQKKQEQLLNYFKRQGKIVDVKPKEVTDGV